MKENSFRIILSGKNSAQTNMATDEAIATSFELDDTPVLRLYSWDDSYTLGVGQKIDEYIDLKKEYKGNFAKRITGGGVLFHGHDLSYSLIVPPSYLEGLSVKESYEKICSFLLSFYKKLGLDVKYVKDDESLILSKSPFCQVGFEAYDIVTNGKKIGGNAQRRTKKFIFQHGSIPIYEPNKITLKDKVGHTLEELGVNTSYEDVEKLIQEVFQDTFDVKLETSSLNQKEQTRLAFLLKEKYDYTN